MPSVGKCPKCGAVVTCAVTKGLGHRKCPKCRVDVAFKDGKVVGTR